MFRRLGETALACGLAAGLMASIGAGPAAADSPLRVAVAGAIDDLDPHGPPDPARTPARTTVLHQIYEPLIRRMPDLFLAPGLATDWEPVEPTRWRFTLRDGVRFHDGTPFTAEDAVFSLRRIQTEGPAALRAGLAGVVEVTAVDAGTLDIVTDTPNPLLPQRLTRILIRARAPTDPAPSATPPANGTGPFRIARFDPGRQTVLVRNAAWWGWNEGERSIERIDIRTRTDAGERTVALTTGRIDLLLDPRREDLGQLGRTPGLALRRGPEPRTLFLGMRQTPDGPDDDARPFSDPRVREALHRAINVTAIARVIMKGTGRPAGILAAPGIAGHTAELDTRSGFDLGAARRLLADAGHADGFAVSLDCPDGRYAEDAALCRAIAGMLSRLDIAVEVVLRSPDDHLAHVRQGRSGFFLLGWRPPTFDSAHVLRQLYRSDGAWNTTGYADAELDALLARAENETDGTARLALLRRAWAIAKRDRVYIPLHHQTRIWAMTDRLDLPVSGDGIPRFSEATWR